MRVPKPLWKRLREVARAHHSVESEEYDKMTQIARLLEQRMLCPDWETFATTVEHAKRLIEVHGEKP